MGGINWGQSAVSFGTTLMDMFEQGRQKRLEDEQFRQIQQQQYDQAQALKASGTVPPSFGSILQSYQPPPLAPAPASGFMGTLGDIFSTIGRSGEGRRGPLDTLPITMRQQSLEAVQREVAAQQAETDRQTRQAQRYTQQEKMQGIRETQQNKMQGERDAAAEARAAAAAAEAEARASAREKAQETRAAQGQEAIATRAETLAEVQAKAKTKADAKTEMYRMVDEYGKDMTQPQMNRFNRLVSENSEAAKEVGYEHGFRWEPGWFGGSVLPVEEGGAAATAAKAAATQTLAPTHQDFLDEIRRIKAER